MPFGSHGCCVAVSPSILPSLTPTHSPTAKPSHTPSLIPSAPRHGSASLTCALQQRRACVSSWIGKPWEAFTAADCQRVCEVRAQAKKVRPFEVKQKLAAATHTGCEYDASTRTCGLTAFCKNKEMGEARTNLYAAECRHHPVTRTPTLVPSPSPSIRPTEWPSAVPSAVPSVPPSEMPTAVPTVPPSQGPSLEPSTQPTHTPSDLPTRLPTETPSCMLPCPLAPWPLTVVPC